MNYPPGAQYDSAAPYNEPRRRTEWQEWFILVEGPSEDNHTLQLSVYFPSWCESYDARQFARAYCVDHKLGLVDVNIKEETHYSTIETNCYYE